jgi:hypothetical protein
VKIVADKSPPMTVIASGDASEQSIGIGIRVRTAVVVVNGKV